MFRTPTRSFRSLDESASTNAIVAVRFWQTRSNSASDRLTAKMSSAVGS